MSATHPARFTSSGRGITLLELLAATAVLSSAVVAAVGATRAARAVLSDHPHTDRAEQALERWRGDADRLATTAPGEVHAEPWTWIDPDGATWSVVAELNTAPTASSPEPAPMQVDAVWAIVRVARSSADGLTIHLLERPALVPRPPESKRKDAAS
jgi:hypothetical protein